MTRAEFLDEVTSWYDLIQFCQENRCDLCDDIYDDESKDDYINEQLVDWAREDGWYDLWRRLDNIPTGYDYYSMDDYGEFSGLDDGDFEDRKDEVIEWADDADFWEEDEEEVEDDEEEFFIDEIDEEEQPIEDEECSLGELFASSVNSIKSIAESELEKAREEDLAFAALMAAV